MAAAARLLRPLALRPAVSPRFLGRPPPPFRPLTRRFHTPPTRAPPPRVPPARGRRPHSTRPTPVPSPRPAGDAAGEAGPLSLSRRLRKLSREYGWSALGVYLALSVLDFPFCLLAIRLLGTERVGRWEHAAYESVKTWLRVPFPNMFPERARVEGGDGAGTDQEGAEVEASTFLCKLEEVRS
jgi:N-terminal acetyltransferase 2